MILNGEIAVILRYATEFGKLMFRECLRQSG